MNPLIKQVLGESVQKDQVLPVIESTRPVKIFLCPHCRTEILEKHSFVDEGGVERHSECKGAFTWPPPSPEEKAWMDQHWGTLLKS
jgi:uncharacterized protein with PIN domain